MENAAKNLDLIVKYFSDLNSNQLAQFADLEALYREWNTKINVISRKDIDSLYERHILHSLSIARFCHFKGGTKIIDIGTGGGFPGIPLAIFFPEVHFLLADSIGKKLRVVEEIASAIRLTNIVTLHARVEEIKNRIFDFVVSRAVAPLADLWKWSKPLLRKDLSSYNEGYDSFQEKSKIPPGLICLKGGDLAAEIAGSGTHPAIVNIHDIFPEPFFIQKFLLYVPK